MQTPFQELLYSLNICILSVCLPFSRGQSESIYVSLAILISTLQVETTQKKKERKKKLSRAIYTFKFQGSCKKSCNNSVKIGVPTPSKRGCQLSRATLPLKVYILTCNRVPTMGPRVGNSAVGYPRKNYKYLRVKATRTYHHCASFSLIQLHKCRNDSPQPGLPPLIISLNAFFGKL